MAITTHEEGAGIMAITTHEEGAWGDYSTIQNGVKQRTTPKTKGALLYR